MIAEHGDKVAIGLDVRGTTLAARGWTQEGGELFATIERLNGEGCARYVVTDVAKDGTLQGRTFTCCTKSAKRRTARLLPVAGCRPWRIFTQLPSLFHTASRA